MNYYSILWWYMECYLAEPDTVLVFGIYLGSIRKWNPPRNAEDNLHAELVIIEAWFRGY